MEKKNGKAKEYDFNGLSFDGEYKYGQRIKGKEYSGSELVFDGEYKNGERWNGYLKEYKYYDGASFISFEGELKDGKHWNGKRGCPGFRTYRIVNGEDI